MAIPMLSNIMTEIQNHLKFMIRKQFNILLYVEWSDGMMAIKLWALIVPNKMKPYCRNDPIRN